MVTASLVGDLFIAVVFGIGVLGYTTLRTRGDRRRPYRRLVSSRLVHDIPIGRIVIASGLARSRRA